jgi:hypothetical protein
MAKAYYSTVFEQPAPDVWKIIRDFNNYSIWVEGAGESRIEDGKSGDTVGAVRSVCYRELNIRQRLLAQSDVERSQTYEFCGPPTLPVTGFQATLRVTPVVDGDRAIRRMVGDVRLRRRPPRRTDRGALRSIRKMARIAARCHGGPGRFPSRGRFGVISGEFAADRR